RHLESNLDRREKRITTACARCPLATGPTTCCWYAGILRVAARIGLISVVGENWQRRGSRTGTRPQLADTSPGPRSEPRGYGRVTLGKKSQGPSAVFV